MKYLIGLLVLFFSFTGISSAQGRGHGGSHSTPHESHGSGNHAPFHPEGHGVRPSHDDHFRGDGGRHTSDRDRWHYDGRHFDRFYHERFFGREHVFFVGRPVFYGGYWRFWYGGYWFNFVEVWPSDWCYCDQVYIDYDDASDCYFLYNPVHPGIRVRVGVVF